MPLIKQSLQTSIELIMKRSFQEAMNEFFKAFSEHGSKDIREIALQKASMTFGKGSSDLANVIDLYIKSATIIVPPGQVVTVAPPTGLGTTTSPSLPANIM